MLLARSRIARRGTTVALCVAGLASAAVLFAASAASAEPSLDAQRRQAEVVLAQVQALDDEVNLAAERFNGANYELRRVSARLRESRAVLRRSRVELGSAQRRAGDRLVDLYVRGAGPSTVEIVLGAASLRDALDALDTSARVVEQDTRIVGELRRLTVRTKQRERQLTAARARQRVLVGRLASERDAIAAKLAEREELLASVRSEVERLEAKERARQAELRRRAEAELARQRQAAAAQALQVPEPEAGAEASTQIPVASPVGAPEPAPAPAPPANASRGAQVVAIAMRYLGIPYKWGGASPATGFDCSGFTMYVFAQIGVSLPHFAAAQFGMGRPVSKSELAPGDLVFFRGLGHMGMYIGGGNFIHSPQTGDVVKISSLSEPNRIRNWVGARRIL